MNGHWYERPGPGELHAQIQFNVCLQLRQIASQLGGKALVEWSITQPEAASQDEPNYLTPDVVFAFSPHQTNARGHLIPPVFLVVEVASPDQEGLVTKAQTYGSWGVSHVWIIYPHCRECVECHGGNQFTLATTQLTAGRFPYPFLPSLLIEQT